MKQRQFAAVLRSQRGAISFFKRKTKFEKFVDSLPEHYKPDAEGMWNQLEAATQKERVAREQMRGASVKRLSRLPVALRRPTTVVLICMAAILVLVLLFPPFYVRLPQLTLSMGHAFLFSPPKYGALWARVDGLAELAEIIGVVALGGVAFLIARRFEDVSEEI